MKRLLFALSLAWSLAAQNPVPSVVSTNYKSDIARLMYATTGSGAPSQNCTQGKTLYFNTANNRLMVCTTTGAPGTFTDILGGITLTASTGTFTLANGKTFVISNSFTLAATDGNSYTFPSTTGGTVITSNAGTALLAAALSSTPSLCTTGQAPTGILANGNATGCAAISGGSGAANPTCTWSSSATSCDILGVTNATTAALDASCWDDTGTPTVFGHGVVTATGSTTVHVTWSPAVTAGHCAVNSGTGAAGTPGAAGTGFNGSGTYASMVASSPATNDVWKLTDASASGGCSAGGSTGKSFCVWNGSAWVVSSGAGSGGVPYTGATGNVDLGTFSLTAGSVIINDATHSGADYKTGLTSGGVATAVADVAGTAITYVWPSTNGAADQVLMDSGTTTCPTLASGIPTTCHLMKWVSVTTCTANGGVVQYSTSTHTWTCHTLVTADMPSSAVQNNQVNTAGSSMTLDLSAASATAGLKVPLAAGAAPTADGFLAVNSTTHLLAFGSNGATKVVASRSGTLTNGNCVSINSTGDFVDAGGACTTGGGGGTVNSGTSGQFGYYASTGTAISGTANFTISGSDFLMGVAGSAVGTLSFGNATSGTIKLTPPTGALGSVVLTFQAATGTIPSIAGSLAIASSKTFTASNTITMTATDGSTLAAGAGGTIRYTVGATTQALGTSAVSANTCTSATTVTVTGAATTDSVSIWYTTDPTGVTGYGAGTSGGITIRAWVSATNTVSLKQCNETGSSVTPGALTVGVGVSR